jgi:hypothetical protein
MDLVIQFPAITTGLALGGDNCGFDSYQRHQGIVYLIFLLLVRASQEIWTNSDSESRTQYCLGLSVSLPQPAVKLKVTHSFNTCILHLLLRDVEFCTSLGIFRASSPYTYSTTTSKQIILRRSRRFPSNCRINSNVGSKEMWVRIPPRGRVRCQR